MTENTLYYGDNLPLLKDNCEDESIDLIYLDPPFNSKANYNILFGGNGKSEAQIRAFDDTWHWGPESESSYADVMEGGGQTADVLEAFRSFLGDNDMMAYLAMMTPRLVELRRVLKITGSLYLHCDPTASHYLKILLDAVFGKKNFRNEIIWHYRRWTSPSKKFQKLHDILLFYTKSDSYQFNTLLTPYTPGSVARKEQGILHRFKAGEEPVLVSDGKVDKKGVPENDVWQIPFIAPSAKERLGYPTQKPLALLERIIKASSNPGDLVLDPFCGCGTAVHAAQKLGRQWIGIDITHLAIGLIEYRLRDAFGIRPKVVGAPEDLAGAHDLFQRDPFQFEAWAVTRIPSMKPNERKTGDKGIDGVGRFYLGRASSGKAQYGKILASVKGGKRLGVSMIRDFRGVLEREGVDLGIFICLHGPTRGMITEAASAGRYRDLDSHDFPRMQIYTITDFFDGKHPELPATIDDARRRAEAETGEQHELI